MLNKKGQKMGPLMSTALIVIIVAGIFSVLSFTGVFSPAEQTAFETIGSACTVDADCGTGFTCSNDVCAAVDLTGVKAGKAATLTLAAFNLANDSLTQEGDPGAYVWLHGSAGDKTLVTNNGNLAATSRLSVTDVSTGDVVDAIAFVTSATVGYYGVAETDVTITKESQPLDLDVYSAIVSGSGVDIDVFNQDDTVYADNVDTVNVSLTGTTDTYKMSRIRLNQNQSNMAWNVGAIGFDVVDGSNITFEIDSSTSGNIANTESGQKLSRISSTEFIFPFSTPVLLLENQELTINGILFENDGTSEGSIEVVTVRLIDYAAFIGATDNQLMFGYEDNSDTEADVGTGDITFTINVNNTITGS